jgi:ribosome-associated protein
MKINVRIKKYAEHTAEIETDFIRLDALLKFAGVVQTGGEAKVYIQDGQVFLNGTPCVQRGKKVYPGDKVTFENIRINVFKKL